MPTYPVINTKTGEKQELNLSMKKYDEWRKENPDWDKDWNAGIGSAVSGVGDWQNKLPQGFKDRLNNVKKHHPYAKFDSI